MTGGTLGQASGFTLGGDAGALLGTLPTEYFLGGQPLPTFVEERATHETLTLTFRVSTERLLNVLRVAKTDEDKIDVLGTDSGGFVAVDRANGRNTFTLDPPPRREPLRQEGTYHVQRYEESVASQTVDSWTVEIEFVRDGNRSDKQQITVQEQGPQVGADAGATLGQEGGFTLGGDAGASIGNQRAGIGGDLWGLETRYGEIATDHVNAEFIGTGADGVERFELTTRFTFDQATAWESALSLLNGVRVRKRPDTTNIAIDDTANDANTITVDSPTEDVVANGDYVVMSWETVRLNDAWQEYEIEIAKAG